LSGRDIDNGVSTTLEVSDDQDTMDKASPCTFSGPEKRPVLVAFQSPIGRIFIVTQSPFNRPSVAIQSPCVSTVEKERGKS
jgi:hypothetical protein